jgi:hypothetical protein
MSSERYKQIKLIINGEMKTTSSVGSFNDLVRYIFKVAELEYLPNLPEGFDPRLACKNWFNFCFEDAQKQTYPIVDENDFQKCLQIYSALKAAKIFVIANKPVQDQFKQVMKIY